jgi:SPT2 chromatin protein
LADLNQFLDNILAGKDPVFNSRSSAPSSRPSTPNGLQKRPQTPGQNISSAKAASTDTAQSLKRKPATELAAEPAKQARKDDAIKAGNSIASVKTQDRSSGPTIIQSNTSVINAAKRPIPDSAARIQPAAAPARPPSKGSFAEIMARGKKVQESKLGKDFQIVHKKTEKKPKETVRDTKGLPVSKDGSKPQPAGKGGKDRVVERGKALQQQPGKAARKLPEPTYKGTSRPSAPAPTYKGTARAKSELARAGQNSATDMRRSAPVQQGRYGSRYDDYDEDDDDVDDYSDASSDMEAGAIDIDMEEEAALRAARAEDAAALREEEELRRRKLARKLGRS